MSAVEGGAVLASSPEKYWLVRWRSPGPWRVIQTGPHCIPCRLRPARFVTLAYSTGERSCVTGLLRCLPQDRPADVHVPCLRDADLGASSPCSWPRHCPDEWLPRPFFPTSIRLVATPAAMIIGDHWNPHSLVVRRTCYAQPPQPGIGSPVSGSAISLPSEEFPAYSFMPASFAAAPSLSGGAPRARLHPRRPGWR